ncbi:MAG TPA: FGGY family carbohydrate kinase, partial [Acidimicrobiia bacterium]|nr:FGGY family carbohydrate kinase [Acidimicrobiia bacterium]
MAEVVLAIDAGTTGVRTVAVGADGASRALAYREFPQHFPRPGWVEHDPEDIWR